MAMRTIGVRFPGDSGQPQGTWPIYTYFVREGDEPELGDIVIARVSWPSAAVNWSEDDLPTDRLGSDMLKVKVDVATVVEVHVVADPRATVYYVQLLPRLKLRLLFADNRELAARMVKHQAAIKQLDAMLAQEDRRARYARLAEANPKAAELLRELGDEPMPLKEVSARVVRSKLRPQRPRTFDDVPEMGFGED